MPSRIVTHWHKQDLYLYVPLASSVRELNQEMRLRDLEWCPECKAAVEPDGHLDADGIANICPFCGTETRKAK